MSSPIFPSWFIHHFPTEDDYLRTPRHGRSSSGQGKVSVHQRALRVTWVEGVGNADGADIKYVSI